MKKKTSGKIHKEIMTHARNELMDIPDIVMSANFNRLLLRKDIPTTDEEYRFYNV